VAAFDGTQLFRNLLGVFKLQPMAKIGDLAKVPANQTVVILFGDLGCLEQIAKVRQGGLKKFADDGGAILVASDRRDDGRLWEFHLQVTGQPPPDGKDALKEYERRLGKGSRVPPLEDLWKGHVPSERYKGIADCILAKDFRAKPHPIFAQCEKGMATNKPSCISRHAGCPFETLCSFPFVRARDPKPGFFIAEDYAFAVGNGATGGPSHRVLFLSGHGVFINVMLAQDDIDNLTFATNILRWLTNDKQRRHCLFVEENQVFTDFSVPIGEPPMPTAKLINDLLRGWEEENFFNRLLLENVRKDTIQKWLLATAVIGLAVFGFRQMLKARFRQDHA
jgi:hypothetical protein